MSIEFFGVGGPPHIGGTKKPIKNQLDKSAEGRKADHVEFSAVLQDVQKARSKSNSEAAERAARVNQLKEQVANGTYQPDIEKVATSLLQFLLETNKS